MSEGEIPGDRYPASSFIIIRFHHPTTQGFTLGYHPAALQAAPPGASIRAVGPGDDSPFPGDTMSTQSPPPRRGRSTQPRAERRLYRRSGTLGQIMPPNPHAAISQGSALGYCSATRGFAPGYRLAALQAARGGTSTRYNHSTTQQFNNPTCLPAALQSARGTIDPGCRPGV